MKIPAFLLRRLYVKGSLATTLDGFEFQIRNKLGSGYARGLLPLTLNGDELDMARTTFEIDGKIVTFDAVSNDTPFTLAMNKTTTIAYTGGAIAEGDHKVGMRFEVAGLGELGFDFTDAASARG
ncbi:MAG: hypothetical protein O2826_09590 [Chloroflexi bacterium]|nr:hypothetical protein [Chloroflexota bacterium]MDA1174754.1 hypothetical protein [Chloroflexota bacterium]